jgi:hypothetical protein
MDRLFEIFTEIPSLNPIVEKYKCKFDELGQSLEVLEYVWGLISSYKREDHVIDNPIVIAALFEYMKTKHTKQSNEMSLEIVRTIRISGMMENYYLWINEQQKPIDRIFIRSEITRKYAVLTGCVFKNVIMVFIEIGGVLTDRMLYCYDKNVICRCIAEYVGQLLSVKD